MTPLPERMPAQARPGLRVLMVGPLPPPVGGMATVVENLAGAFAGRVDLRLLNNAKTTAADRRWWQGVAAQLRLLARLGWGCIRRRPAVVHIHTCSWFTFWRNGVDVLLARLLGRRVVLHIHGGQFGDFLGGLAPMPAWLARRVLGLAQRVVVLGDGWKRLLDAWTDPARVVVVPNGVPIPPPLAAAVATDAPFCILCLAGYTPNKGQADLVRAVARLTGPRPVRLQLFGDELAPGARQSLLDLAATLGLAECVEVPGPVFAADKDRRLRAAHCFCLPSYDEGLPMSMLEAMALGMPVVVTRVGAVPEAVADGSEGLLFEPGDVAALAAHLQGLMDDPARAQAIGEAGRARVIRDFSLERSAGLLIELYGTLAAGSRAGSSAESSSDQGARA